VFRLDLLGTVDLTGPDGTDRDASLRRSKRVALLAYLAAARPRGFHRRDKIAALFWPELPDDRARAALRTTLSRLRDEYGADLIRTRGADEIGVDRELLACDVVTFDEAMATGDFATAAALYRGPLLDGVHVEGTGEELEHWIEGERMRLHTAAVRALCGMADDDQRRGDLVNATAAARRAVDLAPTDELAARLLIGLCIAAGNRGGAMEVYEELARRMRADFGVEPSSETRTLVRAERTPPPAAEGASVLGSAFPASHTPAAPTAHVQRRRPYITVGVAFALLLTAVWVAKQWMSRTAPPAAVSPATPSLDWQRMTVTLEGTPTPRIHAAVLLDSTNDALILIGGILARGEGAEVSPVLGDVWRLAGLEVSGGHRWTQLHPAPGPAPAPRWNALGAYDAAHDRAILFAGALGHTSPCVNETWVLDRASGIGGAPTWHQVRTEGEAPATRAQAAGVYEARSRTLVVFGGNDCFATYMADVWLLTFDDSTLATGRWTRVTPDSSAGAPLRRNAAGVAYDARARRLWVQGGNLGASQELSELWRLDHADGTGGPASWHPVRCDGTAPALGSQVAAYDTTSGTLLMFAGIDETGRSHNDVWFARGLGDGGSRCRWEHAVPTGDAPLPRHSARALFPAGNQGMIVLGGMVESVALMDLWRLDHPFR
jgi:DNA-binding SARP family transcriptional activator